MAAGVFHCGRLAHRFRWECPLGGPRNSPRFSPHLPTLNASPGTLSKPCIESASLHIYIAHITGLLGKYNGQGSGPLTGNLNCHTRQRDRLRLIIKKSQWRIDITCGIMTGQPRRLSLPRYSITSNKSAKTEFPQYIRFRILRRQERRHLPAAPAPHAPSQTTESYNAPLPPLPYPQPAHTPDNPARREYPCYPQ